MLLPFPHALPHSSGYNACRQEGTPLEFSTLFLKRILLGFGFTGKGLSYCESQHAGSTRHASCTWTVCRGNFSANSKECLSSLFGHSDPVSACSSQGDSEIQCDFVLLCDVVTACTESGHAVPALLDEAWSQAITCCKWKVKCAACRRQVRDSFLAKKCVRYLYPQLCSHVFAIQYITHHNTIEHHICVQRLREELNPEYCWTLLWSTSNGWLSERPQLDKCSSSAASI